MCCKLEQPLRIIMIKMKGKHVWRISKIAAQHVQIRYFESINIVQTTCNAMQRTRKRSHLRNTKPHFSVTVPGWSVPLLIRPFFSFSASLPADSFVFAVPAPFAAATAVVVAVFSRCVRIEAQANRSCGGVWISPQRIFRMSLTKPGMSIFVSAIPLSNWNKENHSLQIYF